MVGLGTKGDAEELHPVDLSFIFGIFGIFGNAATTAALEVVGSIVSVLEEVLVVLVGFILLLGIALVVVVEGVISFLSFYWKDYCLASCLVAFEI